MRTPHGSVLQSQQSHVSPASTLTPGSSKDMSVIDPLTPSSIPLPPATPGEESALRSPTSDPLQSGSFPSVPPLPSSPPLIPEQGSVDQDIISPISSIKTSTDVGADGNVDDFFNGTTKRKTHPSTGSSSSTSLEVSEIMEGVRTSAADEDHEEELYEDAKEEEEDDEDEEEEEEEAQVKLHERGDAVSSLPTDSQELDDGKIYY